MSTKEEYFYHIVDANVMELEEEMGKLHRSDSLLVQHGFFYWENFLFVKMPRYASNGTLKEEEFYDILGTIVNHFYSGNANNSELKCLVDEKMRNIKDNLYNMTNFKQ
jgi:hypothetical protein